MFATGPGACLQVAPLRRSRAPEARTGHTCRVPPEPWDRPAPRLLSAHLEPLLHPEVDESANVVVDTWVGVGERRGVHELRGFIEYVVHAGTHIRISYRCGEVVADVYVHHEIAAHLPTSGGIQPAG